MKKYIKTFLAFFIILSLVTLSGCGCKEKAADLNLTLEVWGFLDDRDAFSEIFDNYKNLNPSIRTINYRKLSVDTYKKELLEALASGQGPDILMIHNTWLPSFMNKLAPAPKEILGEQKYRNNFVDVCVADFLVDGIIWAAPLSVDTLGLYYNKDLFNAAGITTPPKKWGEFIEDVKMMTKINSNGEIVQSGVAMGTATNVNRPTDILNLLMLQNGAKMSDNFGRVTLSDKEHENALNFYVQFAKTDSSSYAWNPRMHYSLDAFSEGNVAMMLNYSWHIQTIRDKSPKLNFAVTGVPQSSEFLPINYANYWAYAVAKNKKAVSANQETRISDEIRINETWKFLTYLTTRKDSASVQTNVKKELGKTIDPNLDPAGVYAEKMRRPAARRDIIEKQLKDPDLGPFAKSNLSAKSWKQVDPDATESILGEMITQVNHGEFAVADALRNAAAKINVSAGK